MKISGVSYNQTNSQAKKKSNVGAKIGAAVGFASASTALYLNKNIIDKIFEKVMQKGNVYKNIEKIAQKRNYNKLQTKKLYTLVKNAPVRMAAILRVIIATGIGAIAGKGIQKAYRHFFKTTVNDNKKNTLAYEPKTIKGKDNQEYIVVKGHPKTLYRKNPQTGKFEQVTQVYDGSWGKEISDEALVRMMTTMVK